MKVFFALTGVGVACWLAWPAAARDGADFHALVVAYQHLWGAGL